MRISWKSRAISAGNTPIQQRSRLPMIGNSSDRNRTNDRIGDGIPPERTPARAAAASLVQVECVFFNGQICYWTLFNVVIC